MEIIAKATTLGVVRWGQVSVVAVAIGAVAVSGGLPGRAVQVALPPTPAPVIVTPPPTPEPTPEPTPTPAPTPPAITRAEIREAEDRLSAMAYWTGAIDGVLDGNTRHAVIAFQKVVKRPRTGRLTPAELHAIRSATRPTPRVGGYRHIEVDIARQVLFLVETGGRISHVLPISSGNGKNFTSQGWTRRAVTPRGRFAVYRKIPGWRVSPLGKLYYPNYIVGGIAIHGAPSVPASPASHGCVRIPMYAATEFYNLATNGTVVIVHDGGPMEVQEEDVASPPGMDNPDASQPLVELPSPEPTVTPAPTTSAPPATPAPTPSPSPSPAPTP